ncbi:hypothetical protein [Methylobacterium hispanicum]|uniref:hypothetical protein n=1 Tax=Methylobacterium hispanicum TaxID=270350 RepID=UPI002F34E8C5
MARRPDPRQPTLFDALPAGPVVRPGVDAALAGEVLTAILDILPPGVPTYVREVVAVERDRAGRLIADLIVFDGPRHRLRISGTPGARGYAWLTDVLGDWPGFYWNERREAWVRLPKDWEDEIAA